jgi:hypothetical protein
MELPAPGDRAIVIMQGTPSRTKDAASEMTLIWDGSGLLLSPGIVCPPSDHRGVSWLGPAEHAELDRRTNNKAASRQPIGSLLVQARCDLLTSACENSTPVMNRM